MYVCIVSAIMSSTEVPSPPILMQPNNTDVLDVSITLRWNEPMDIEIDRYRIEYRVKVYGLEWMVAIVDPPVTSHVITGLSPVTTYEVRIFAISIDDVTSVAADHLSVTTEGCNYCIILIISSCHEIIIEHIIPTYIPYFITTNNVANSFYN